jgi:hypothetical protein
MAKSRKRRFQEARDLGRNDAGGGFITNSLARFSSDALGKARCDIHFLEVRPLKPKAGARKHSYQNHACL